MSSIIGKKPCIDGDGNYYKQVKIGDQVWMAENLKTTKYTDGTSIPLVTDNSSWAALTTHAYCYPDNDISLVNSGSATNVTTLGHAGKGLFYNWWAVDGDGSGDIRGLRDISPEGWHVPSNTEWYGLFYYLRDNGFGYDEAVAPGPYGEGTSIAKSMADTGGWRSIGTNEGDPGYDQLSNNTSGFTGLATGYRAYDDGDFDFSPNKYAEWWSSTYFSGTGTWSQTLRYDYHSWVFGTENKKYGHSIRCVSDETLIEAW